ncbi:MAG: hypothetical protein ACLSVN_00005, partial [Collinsella sp.]
ISAVLFRDIQQCSSEQILKNHRNKLARPKLIDNLLKNFQIERVKDRFIVLGHIGIALCDLQRYRM